MKWEIPILAGSLLAVAGVSRRLTGTPFTSAMAFVLIGLVVGPFVLDEVSVPPASETVRTLAEATLAVVLFADASRIKLRVLRQESAVPLRLLAIGLPLTILVGALLAAVMFAHLNAAEAVVLAVLLAPKDAALGQVEDLAKPARPQARTHASGARFRWTSSTRPRRGPRRRFGRPSWGTTPRRSRPSARHSCGSPAR